MPSTVRYHFCLLVFAAMATQLESSPLQRNDRPTQKQFALPREANVLLCVVLNRDSGGQCNTDIETDMVRDLIDVPTAPSPVQVRRYFFTIESEDGCNQAVGD